MKSGYAVQGRVSVGGEGGEKKAGPAREGLGGEEWGGEAERGEVWGWNRGPGRGEHRQGGREGRGEHCQGGREGRGEHRQGGREGRGGEGTWGGGTGDDGGGGCLLYHHVGLAYHYESYYCNVH